MSTTYEIELDAAAFEPCSKVTGSIRSTGDADVELELQLVWTTSGKGNADRDVVCTERLRLPAGELAHVRAVATGRPQVILGRAGRAELDVGVCS